MKKTLMALAVGAAFAAPAAYADVTISGAINMGVAYLNVGNASTAGGSLDGTSNFGVTSNYTNVTISSLEDLGGGLKLDFAAQIAWDTKSVNTLSNRNSHIGLVGESWGGVWIGSNENIYERYFYTIDPLDGAAGLGGNLQMLGTPGGAVFTTCGQSAGDLSSCGYTWYRRDEQTIWYDSPNFNGFTFGVVWQTNYAKDPGTSTNPNMYQLGVKYVGTGMPLEAWFAYGNRKDQFGLINAGLTTGGTTSKDTAWHTGVAYTLGDVKIFGGYEDLKYKVENVALATDVSEYKRDAWYIGLKWNLASGYVGAQWIQALKAKAQLGSTGSTDTVADTGANMIGLGYYHNMSKQTQAYVMGTWIDNGNSANYQTAGIGNASSGNLGSTQWGLTVGMKHSF